MNRLTFGLLGVISFSVLVIALLTGHFVTAAILWLMAGLYAAVLTGFNGVDFHEEFLPHLSWYIGCTIVCSILGMFTLIIAFVFWRELVDDINYQKALPSKSFTARVGLVLFITAMLCVLLHLYVTACVFWVISGLWAFIQALYVDDMTLSEFIDEKVYKELWHTLLWSAIFGSISVAFVYFVHFDLFDEYKSTKST